MKRKAIFTNLSWPTTLKRALFSHSRCSQQPSPKRSQTVRAAQRIKLVLSALVLPALLWNERECLANNLPLTAEAFLQKHCMSCHDADSARAGFRIDLLSADFAEGNNAGQWKEVMDKINGGEMPPKKKPRPNAEEAFALTSWVAQKLDETTKIAQGAGGRVPMRRLNRVEYANTVRDLLSLEENFARRIEKELPADGKAGGFDRGAAGLFMDEGQLAQYMAVADLILNEAVFNDEPKVQKFSYDGTAERYVHGLTTAYIDDSGAVVETNVPGVAGLKDPLSWIPQANFDQWGQKTGAMCRTVRTIGASKTAAWST